MTGALDREQMILQYLPLVKYMAGRMQVKLPPHLDREDLVSYGVLGLMDALDKYDPGRGIKFETYASRRIKGAILDALRRDNWAPRSVLDRLRQVERAYRQMESQWAREAGDEEVAAAAGMSVEELQETLAEGSRLAVESLERFFSGGAESNFRLLDTIQDVSSPDPEVICVEEELVGDLTRALERLGERDYLVLSLYYFEELTLKEIGKILEVSESRVSQLHGRALLRLRGEMEKLR